MEARWKFTTLQMVPWWEQSATGARQRRWLPLMRHGKPSLPGRACPPGHAQISCSRQGASGTSWPWSPESGCRKRLLKSVLLPSTSAGLRSRHGALPANSFPRRFPIGRAECRGGNETIGTDWLTNRLYRKVLLRDSPFSPQEARLVGAAHEPAPVVLHPMPVAPLQAGRSPLLREAAVSDRAACARSLLLQQFSPG